MSDTHGWIGFDLDGTLAEYKSWVSSTHIGPPIAPMVARLKAYRAQGWECRILTARASMAHPGATHEDVQANLKAIREWCLEHLGEVLKVTCMKDYAMVRLYDDLAVGVIKNTGRLVGNVEPL